MTDEDRTNEGLDGTIQVKNDTVIVQDHRGRMLPCYFRDR